MGIYLGWQQYMQFEKLIRLNPSQIRDLEEVKIQIRSKGGNVSISQLIRDSVQIFLDYYREDAINRYSSVYEKNDDNESA